MQLLYVSLETYTFSCLPSFFLFSLILSFCCLAFICPLRWSKILKQHFVNCMLQRYLPILLVLLPFPHICVITYILTMLLNFWLFVCWCFVLFLFGWLVWYGFFLPCILTLGSGTLEELSHTPVKMGFKCDLILHTFFPGPLYMCISAIYHICHVIITINYVYAREAVARLLWNI